MAKRFPAASGITNTHISSHAGYRALNPQSFVLSVQNQAEGRAVKRIQFANIVDFATFVRTAPPVSDKLASRGVVGATYAGNVRENANIVACNAATLDFDTPLDGQFDAVCALLESEGITYVAHGTFSNHGRFAVVIPFAAPTDLIGHAAAIEDLRARLGAYGNFAAESGRPGQLRFVSPNVLYADRTVREYNGTLYAAAAPTTAITDAPLAPLATVTPIRSFEAYSEQSSPAQKRLFLLALQHNLIKPSRLDSYLEWQPLLFAGFRAWGFGLTDTITESQLELIEMLKKWSSLHPKYRPGCVEAKLTDYLAGKNTSNALHIHSVIAKETDTAGLRFVISQDGSLTFDDIIDLTTALDKLVGSPVKLVPQEVLQAASIERQAQASKNAEMRLRTLTVMARLPRINERFDEFVDLMVAFATQGQATRDELNETSWDYFLRPAPVILAFAQLAAMGFAPHVLFRLSPSLDPKALNLYSVGIAKAGTGKSATLNLLKHVLSHTVFKNSMCDAKLHSATGLWTNYIEKKGNIVLVVNDEAEALIGKNAQIDQHLAALHTFLKQAFDGGIPGQRSRPSAQVQRELAEVAAVTVSLHLSATPTLLRNDVSKNMLTDGFMSRVIVTIDERDSAESTRDDKLDAKLKLMDTEAEHGLDVTIPRAVSFFNKLWKDGNHPAGQEFFSVMPDQPSSDLVTIINSHFERGDLPVRYVTPPKDRALRRRFADISLRATERWTVPPGLRGTDAEAAVDSLKVRAEVKLHTLATILTLIADPLATEVNVTIMDWCEEFLYLSQHGFYQHLLNTAAVVSMAPSWKVNREFVEAVRPAVCEGGMLFAGPAKSNELAAHYGSAWRKLISNLRSEESSDRYKMAIATLDELNVGYTDNGSVRTFFIKSDTE